MCIIQTLNKNTFWKLFYAYSSILYLPDCRRFYYGLDNYYQNHRRYLNSWDPSQLRGEDLRRPDDNCRPITRYTLDGESGRLPVAPCGLIANSWFNGMWEVVQYKGGLFFCENFGEKHELMRKYTLFTE